MSHYRLNLFIQPEHAQRLDELAAKKGVSKSSIVAAALASWLSPDAADQREGALTNHRPSLRTALRAAAAADNGYDYRCVVWDLGGLQLYRLRDAVRWSESSPRCVASGALFFLERDTFVPARHVMQAANTGFLEQIHYQNQLKVAAAAAGRFVGFLEDNFGRTLPAGVRKPVFQVRVTT